VQSMMQTNTREHFTETGHCYKRWHIKQYKKLSYRLENRASTSCFRLIIILPLRIWLDTSRENPSEYPHLWK